MIKFFIQLSLFMLLSNYSFSQENAVASKYDGLLKEGEILLDNRDFEKAKLTFKLYQKYVENIPEKWINAQLLLLRCNIETNNLLAANKLLSQAKEKANKVSPLNSKIIDRIDLLKAEIYEIKNEFYKAEAIYREMFARSKSSEVQIMLANNLIDRVLTGYSKKAQQDYDEIRGIVTNYEKNESRNPLELIRIKQKVSSYQMINKETLLNHEKLSTYWIRKDEFILIKIYLNNALRKYDAAFNVWNENKDLISLKTHPLSIPTLVNLSRHFISSKLENSIKINQTLQVLIRDDKEKSLVNEVIIEQLLAQKKTAEALSLYQDFVKNTPNAHNKNAILVSLAEAFLEQNDFKTAGLMINTIPEDSILNPEDKSRSVYITASLLQAEGKDLDAAVLFLRVGQTASNPQIALKSLFMAGKSFYGANQCKRAVIAFKMLLENKRSKYTDEAMYLLSRSHSLCNNFKEALSVIDQIVITGKNPELKKKALFEKGDYYLKAGDVSKAIESYNDYTVVYTDDSRNAAIWLKIYDIHRSLKDLQSCEKMLSKIIAQTSKSSPEIYSKALHQKAIIYQLRGKNRKSIALWQNFLEFNQKVQTPLTDEVKLMLAAAYQNSEVLNLDAAKSIYLEIIQNSDKIQSRNVAVYNLLKVSDSSSKSQQELIAKILTLDSEFSDESSNLALELAFKNLNSDTHHIKNSCRQFIAKIKEKDSQGYWKARLLFQDKKYTETIKLLKNIKTERLANKKNILLKNAYLALKKPEDALNSCLDIIYSFSSHLSQKKYSGWEDIEDAALTAAKLLKSMGQNDRLLKIKERIILSKIPNSDAIAKAIDKILEEKG